MRHNRQLVILETNEGSCRNLKVLKEVWKLRLKENAPHYKFICGKIIKQKKKQYI